MLRTYETPECPSLRADQSHHEDDIVRVDQPLGGIVQPLTARSEIGVCTGGRPIGIGAENRHGNRVGSDSFDNFVIHLACQTSLDATFQRTQAARGPGGGDV
jgi:hypothetical protein